MTINVRVKLVGILRQFSRTGEVSLELDDPVTVECLVTDTNTSLGIPNYPVTFWTNYARDTR